MLQFTLRINICTTKTVWRRGVGVVFETAPEILLTTPNTISRTLRDTTAASCNKFAIPRTLYDGYNYVYNIVVYSTKEFVGVDENNNVT